MEQRVFSVTEVNQYIKQLIDDVPQLNELLIRGELSNYKIYPSGHHYFTLKDGESAIRCVMFRSSAGKLRFRPESGMQVIAGGRISVYPRDGAYQLCCTSRRRYPIAKVLLLPVRVQGVEAPPEIVGAIRYANRWQLADVLIVGRGGGSIEDLWAFNDERVARAIYASEIPVISAVGHEPDVTISDFVADRRASTPSNAAEIAVPDQVELRKQLSSVGRAMAQGTLNTLEKADRQLKALAAKRVLTDPMAFIEDRRMQLDSVQQRLGLTAHRQLGARQQQFTALAASLDALSPLKVLGRGYAMVQAADGTVLRTSRQTAAGDRIHVQLGQGALDCTVERTIDGKEA